MPNHKTDTGCRPDQLFGFWLMDPDKLETYRARAVEIDLEALARMNAEAEAKEAKDQGDGPPPKPYAVENGVAVINISGPTTKYPTSYSRILGGTSTMLVERALSQAVEDPDVKAVMIHFDSAPGGTVAGAFELHDRIMAVREKKPVFGHGDDMMTSAAQLFGSACQRLTANRTCIAGSIGTRAQLVDSSEKLKRDGIKVIPIAAGKYKAAGTAGTKITDDQIANFQREIDGLNDEFVNDVVRGRAGKLTADAVRKMEARCYVGEEARRKGLIDGVCSFEKAMGHAQQIAQQTTGAGGIPGTVFLSAAPNDERRVRMDLLTQIRELFGAAEMTEEQAIAKVRSMKNDLGTAQAAAKDARDEQQRLSVENGQLKAEKPKPADPEALKDRADLVSGRIDLAVEKHDLTPAIATKLKGAVLKDGKPNAFMLSTSAELGARPIDFILGMFDGAQLAPATGSQTPSQIDRVTPGANAGTEDAAKIAKAGEDQGKAYAEKQLRARGVNAA
jgi:signal peptide peptidase SppA